MTLTDLTLSIEQSQGKPHGRMITLAHGVRYTADLGYRWELDELSRHEEFDFLYVPMASRPQEDRHWMPEVGRGRATALLEGVTPAGFELFFEALGQLSGKAATGAISPEEFDAKRTELASKYHVDLLPEWADELKARFKLKLLGEP